MTNFIHAFQARASFGRFPKSFVLVKVLFLALMFGTNAYSQTTIWSNTLTGSINSATTPFTTGQTVASNITVSGIVKGAGLTGQTLTEVLA